MTYGVLLMTYDVLLMTYGVLRMTYAVLPMTYGVLRMTYDVLRMTFDVLRMTHDVYSFNEVATAAILHRYTDVSPKRCLVLSYVVRRYLTRHAAAGCSDSEADADLTAVENTHGRRQL